MNDYVLVSGDFATSGGMDRANYELAWYLAETRRARVHLVSYFVESPLTEHPNITWYKVPKPLNAYLLGDPFLNYYGCRVAGKLAPRGARVIVNGGNCEWADINWVHYVHAAYRPEAKSGALRSWKTWWAHRYAIKAEKRCLRKAKLVITNSHRTRDDVITYLGVEAERVHPIYLEVDDQEFHPASVAERQQARALLNWPNSRYCMLFVGALGDRRKGFDVVFEAWKRLCQNSEWDVDLVAYGVGAELESWRACVSACGLKDRIKLPGFTKQMSQVMKAADGLISPTRYEAYGLGVHEALCTGLPAFVTRTAGVAERYPANLSNLLLNAPPTPEDLIERLWHWRRNIDEFAPLIKTFSALLLRRTWEDVATDIVASIERATTLT